LLSYDAPTADRVVATGGEAFCTPLRRKVFIISMWVVCVCPCVCRHNWLSFDRVLWLLSQQKERRCHLPLGSSKRRMSVARKLRSCHWTIPWHLFCARWALLA